MPAAEIITIGTEILLGEIIDTNARYIARNLRENGVDVYRTCSVGDNVSRIADMIQESLGRAQIIITTGGLGPTVDDPTREAVAQAFGVPVEFQETLWEQVIERFARFNRFPSENNKKQAFMPVGATAIENPVGTAPAFMMETETSVVISLPGVPREMEYLIEQAVLPYLKARYQLNSVLRVRVLHTTGAGESHVDEQIADLERLENPTVGLAAHSGQVDVRIAAKAASAFEAAEMIAPLEAEIRGRLGSLVYGADEDTLGTIALESLAARGWNLAVIETGLVGDFITALAQERNRKRPDFDAVFTGGEIIPLTPSDPSELLSYIKAYASLKNAAVGLAVGLYPGEPKSSVHLAVVYPGGEKRLEVPYGGPPKLANQRAVNLGMDLIRKIARNGEAE